MINQRHKALVVDDDLKGLKLLVYTLERDGYEVLVAQSAAMALELIRETVPDIFLLDVMMPEVDGYRLCEILKQDERLKGIPVIFITAKTATTDIVKGFESGAVDYITKPFNRVEALARVRTHVRLYKSLQEIDRLRQLALDSNPLTQLPGNNTIARTIQEMIEKKRAATVIYCDLDNFKAYNDQYGFYAGDRVLLFAARTFEDALKAVCGGNGFLGHIGGDDFIMSAPSDRVKNLTRRIIRHFDEGIGAFYTEEDRQRGYIDAVDRAGRFLKITFTSVSMVGVDLACGRFSHYLEVSTACSELKKKAKVIEGSVYCADRRRGRKAAASESVLPTRIS